MRTSRAQSLASRGFTLIDLAIILAVMSILAAVVVPGQISMLHGAKAEVTARQIAAIQDAARWVVYLNAQPTLIEPQRTNSIAAGLPLVAPHALVVNGMANTYIWDDGSPGPADRTVPSWPGQRWGMADNYRCAGMMDGSGGRDLLMRVGNLGRAGGGQEAAVFTNPWGEPLLLSLDGPTQFPADIGDRTKPTYMVGGVNVEANCWFTVTTSIPADMTSVFKRFLPNAVCNDTRPDACSADPMYAVPPEFVRCCTSIPRPGWEPSLRAHFVDAGGDKTLMGPVFPARAPYCHPWSTARGGRLPTDPPDYADPNLQCELVDNL
jgi:type II secretory pathway pseudopilin PulG